MRTTPWIVPAAAVCVVLAGCGGGGGDGPGDGGGSAGNVPGTDVPAPVQTSIADVIAFAKSLIASTSETSDPVAIEGATLATSDTDEPAEL
ncbi:hypothetical protein [Pseudorhodoferax soli]|jgi:hypothetical protein|uniref:Lipoprotein n=1 Tax=Pseudorhodoferax soli TaxID=545864 RepID=A0A368Y8F0_9BURK|nr:hypothetical protein [Pseudorhodoferax soli]RCW76375.1 hypothetical protein DES41_101981 [Pseudorhodoferax soli]